MSHIPTLLRGDCLELMKTLPDASVDAVVTDPPYGLSREPDMAEVLRHWMAGDDYTHTGSGFMGKSWDSFVPGPSVWREALRVLKPGGHLLAFFGSRTYDMGTLAIRIAGFEIRDQIMWLYGSGFPKSLNVANAVDSQITLGGSSQRQLRQRDMGEAYRPHKNAGTEGFGDGNLRKGADGDRDMSDAAGLQTDAARQWEGWGTALKPAHEPICVARKPLVGTVAANVLEHGTGALNIDGCRIAHETINGGNLADNPHLRGTKLRGAPVATSFGREGDETPLTSQQGRWPANVIHDGSEEATAGLADAARFFYCPKASKSDRGEGNTHPTVKPTELMAYLCRLVTPPGGTVLDPFTGSGTTGIACMNTGRSFIGMERDAGYFDIACQRIAAACKT